MSYTIFSTEKIQFFVVDFMYEILIYFKFNPNACKCNKLLFKKSFIKNLLINIEKTCSKTENKTLSTKISFFIIYNP